MACGWLVVLLVRLSIVCAFCGYSEKVLISDLWKSSNGTARVIGGSVAQDGQWPWHVFIHYRNYVDGQYYICGGSLISHHHILTAAHCAITMDTTSSYAYVDVKQITNESVDGQAYQISKKTIYAHYSASFYRNPSQLHDIAVLELTERVTFSKRVYPVCLPGPSTELKDYAIISGYGRYNHFRDNKVQIGPSPRLLYSLVPLIEQEICSERWQEDLIDYGGGFPIEDSQLCAGATGHGSAQGDSGGPLVQQHEGRWYQIGIVSLGVNSGKGYMDQSFAPGIYTRVSSYCDFIWKVTSGEVECSSSLSNCICLITVHILLIIMHML